MTDYEEENQQLRKYLAKIASLYLELLMDQKLSDGSSVLEVVFEQDPQLAKQFREFLNGKESSDVCPVCKRPEWFPHGHDEVMHGWSTTNQEGHP